MPKTRFGKWSVKLLFVFFLLITFFQILVISGQRGGDTFFDNLLLSVPFLTVGMAGIASMIVGLWSVIHHKERNYLVYLAIGVGFFILIFLIGEVISPH